MMNIYKMNTQKIPISHVCSMDKRKSKRINKDETLLNVYYMDKSESESIIFECMFFGQEQTKRFNISVNTSEVKDATNETRHE